MTLLDVERIKLTSTRSPWWCAVLALVLCLGLNVLSVANFPPNEITVRSTQLASPLGMMIVMVMATLSITTEYRFGTIRTTFQAVPNRAAVLTAKTVVVALVAGVLGEIIAFISYGLARLIVPAADLSLGSAEEWRHVAGLGLLYCLAAVLAVAVGLLVRHTAAAITILLVYILLLENLVAAIPRIGPMIQKWMPVRAAENFVTAGSGSLGPPGLDELPYGPWLGLAYSAGIVLLLQAAALLVATLRDA